MLPRERPSLSARHREVIAEITVAWRLLDRPEMTREICALAGLRMQRQDCVTPRRLAVVVGSCGMIRTESIFLRERWPWRRSGGNLADRRELVENFSRRSHRGFGQAWRYAAGVCRQTELLSECAILAERDRVRQHEVIVAEELPTRWQGRPPLIFIT